MLASSLLVIHDTSGGGEDNVTELTGWQELDNPLLEIGETDVVTGRDNTSLVKTAVQLDDDLARSVVIDLLEFTNVTCKTELACCERLNVVHQQKSENV